MADEASPNVQKLIDSTLDELAANDLEGLTDEELDELEAEDDRKGMQEFVTGERERRTEPEPEPAAVYSPAPGDEPDPPAESFDVVGEDGRRVSRNLPQAWAEEEARRICHETGETFKVVASSES